MKKTLIFCLIYIFIVYLLKTRPSFILDFGYIAGYFLNLFLFLLGGALGYYLFYLDYFLYPYLADKTDELARKVEADYFAKKDFLAGIKFLTLNGEKMNFHVLKTAINFAALIILTFFVSSSSGSYAGAGASFGLLFQFNYYLWQDYKNPAALNRWFAQIKKPVEPRYQRYFVVTAIILSLLISL